MSNLEKHPLHPESPGVLTKIKLPVIVVKIGATTALLSVIAISSYAYFKNYRDVIAFATTAIGVSAGVTSAFYVGQNIRLSVESRNAERELKERELIESKVERVEVNRQNQKLKKEDRSLSYISTFSSPPFAEIRTKISSLSECIKGVQRQDQPKIIREHLQSNPEIEEPVLSILNFLEEISVSIESELVDEKILEAYFSFIFTKYYISFKPWIDDRRNGRDDRLFKSFENIYNKWNSNGYSKGGSTVN